MKKVIIFACFVLLFGNRWFPAVPGLNPVGVTTLSIFVGTMLLMILVDITWPVYPAIAALTLNGIFPMNEALKLSFGNHIFMFVLMNTLVLAVLRDSGVLKRIAVWMMTRPISKKNPWFFLIAMYLSELILGCFMNCTVIIILYCTIAETIFDAMGLEKGDKMTEQISIGVLVICAMSYGISPIGHPVAIIAMELFSSLQAVNYAQFLMVGLLSAAVFFVLFLLVMRFVFRLDVEKFRSFDPELLKKGIGPITKEEIVSLGIFLIVVVWWILPGLIRNILPGVYTFMDNLGYCFPLLLAITFFCTVPVNGKVMMHHITSLKRDASWQAAYPMATAMMLSAAITRPEAGITEFAFGLLRPALGSMPAFVFVLVASGAAMLLTNFSNITIIVTLFGTVAVTLMQSSIITGVAAGPFCIVFAISACMAVATVSSTYGAITFSSGWVTKKKQLTQGLTFAVLAWLVTILVGYPFGMLLFA